ncbi:DUF4421 domain-containing protein [Flavobacterium sp. CBA20B-1]|uniref:DUF4421 domain-containing protein n=1 Tax=unclassified Flavobacterium TaxID=196869 RepID=UPI002225AD45|nr:MULTISPECIES: DUF4421 domain-containing protein [unclassified Flavobacterium]WCM43423.1 DUF4421 domain-containing protein [Flavobacterium sp. CBA20B-1]
MDKLIWFCVITFFPLRVVAQNDTLNTYAVSYDEKVVASITYQNSSNSFLINYQDIEGNYQANFTPNTQQKLVVGLSYKLIDLSIGFTPNFLKTDASKLESNNFNLGFRFNYKKWYQSLTFINQKGFFVDYNNYERFYMPRFRSTKLGGTTSYVFNDKFSYKTIFNQNQWQQKSAGSFVPNFSVYYTNLTSKDTNEHLHIDIYTFSLAPSYYYNWVIHEKFLISGGLLVGAGINIAEKKARALYEISTNIRLGYNTNDFFAYLGINSTNFFEKESQGEIFDSFAELKLAAGYRFDPPKKVKKTYDDIIQKFGF